MGNPVALTPEDWARIRYEYECTTCKVVEICAEHGISAGTLRDRVRRWGWKRRWSPVPREGPPPMAVPLIAFAAPDGAPPGPGFCSDERQEDGQAIPLTPAHDARPIGQQLQGAIAHVMPALETTLASLAAGPMQPRAMEQAARALGSLTRTLRELHGLVAQHGAQRGDDDAGEDTCDDTCEDVEELRERLSRQIDALIEEEREARPRRYLAGWEEFAAAAANPAAVTRFFSKQKSNRKIAKSGNRQSPR